MFLLFQRLTTFCLFSPSNWAPTALSPRALRGGRGRRCRGRSLHADGTSSLQGPEDAAGRGRLPPTISPTGRVTVCGGGSEELPLTNRPGSSPPASAPTSSSKAAPSGQNSTWKSRRPRISAAAALTRRLLLILLMILQRKRRRFHFSSASSLVSVWQWAAQRGTA